MNIAINGFGRIGRTAARILTEKSPQSLVAINDLTDNKTLAHLLAHDSNYGRFKYKVGFDSDHIIINDRKIPAFAEKDPLKLPWHDLEIDVVLECTGHFTNPDDAKLHIKAGAKQVIISAPPKGPAQTVVLGVNPEQANGKEIISNASCTTNCVTPIAAVIQYYFGIEKAMMTTIHSYTADQNLQDGPHKDLRRARSAGINIVPTTTGAAVSATEVIPELKGLFDGLAIRVPTSVVSLSDFTFLVKKQTTVEEVNEVLKEASTQPHYKGILDFTEEELVSTDFIGNSASAIVDLKLTQVVGGNMVKVVAWYDNEFGYSSRLVELALRK
ncbi:type I glyceraldehyde-3-phosphate dehydrogenase [Candidatus Berkelbacteria bacterium]|nr:type I glyceraldehyde-3-phosphate dehydrogenase [Candidatus Berkelbacteria bacterium]